MFLLAWVYLLLLLDSPLQVKSNNISSYLRVYHHQPWNGKHSGRSIPSYVNIFAGEHHVFGNDTYDAQDLLDLHKNEFGRTPRQIKSAS
ncbi:uncharacterized protein DMAD_02738 [Drosophila madeirensis]|uniref:Uncharacterized protein n=1 Tax=Drosophila madeirensis TaxID=30013 RepID=A0AAU9G6E4_DROMD